MTTYQYQSPIGKLYLEVENLVFTRLILPTQTPLRTTLNNHMTLPQEYAADLDTYFQGLPIVFHWPTQLFGTNFQQQVWQQLASIKYGETSTYKIIAESCNTKGYQAVGRAISANPLPIIIPCHRVLGTHSFGGYNGGITVKSMLLALEGALPGSGLGQMPDGFA